MAMGISGLLVKPDGSNRTWLNLLTSASRVTPYCNAIYVSVAMVSIMPDMVLPSLAMRMKISPTVPSS